MPRYYPLPLGEKKKNLVTGFTGQMLRAVVNSPGPINSYELFAKAELLGASPEGTQNVLEFLEQQGLIRSSASGSLGEVQEYSFGYQEPESKVVTFGLENSYPDKSDVNLYGRNN